MKENKDGHDYKEKYSFIQEKIVPKPKNTKKKLFRITCYTIVLGLIFGVVSSFTFHLSEYTMKKWSSEEPKEPISLTDGSDESVEKAIVQTPSVVANDKNMNNQKDKITPYDISQTYDIRSYEKMYSVLKQLANESRYSMVTVSAVKDATSWFDKKNSEQSYGLIIRIQADYIYILCNYKKIKNANKIVVEFFNQETVRAKFMGCHKETSLALLKVKSKLISGRTKGKIKEAVLGNPYQIGCGTPVLGLGAPDGTMKSIAAGYITAQRIDKSIVDGKLGIYHTSVVENPYGEGFFINMDGKVLGVITHCYKEKSDQNIMSFIDIMQLKPIIESMLNEKKTSYLGVKVSSELSSNDLKKLNVSYGVYITDIIVNSPAFKQGLRTGDVITQIDDTSISSVAGLMAKIAEKEPGDKMKFTIMRESKSEYPKVVFHERTVTVTMG